MAEERGLARVAETLRETGRGNLFRGKGGNRLSSMS